MGIITKAIIFLIVFPCSLATAGTVEENTRLKLDMEALAASLMPKIDETFQNMNDSKLKKMVGYEGTNIEGVGLTLEQAEAAGKAKREKVYPEGEDSMCTKNSCEVGHTFSTKAMLDRENDLEALGFSKDEKFFTKNNKGYLDAALKVSKEVGDKFDFLTGNYSDCEKGSQVMEIRSIETCDQYYDIKETSCPINQIVEIEPKYTYLCSKKRSVYEKKCESKLNLRCESDAQVTESSGIVSHSPTFRDVAGDVNREDSPYHFEYKNLNLGHTCLDKTCFAVTEGRDSRNGIVQFDVVNAHLIKEFQLSRSGRAGSRCSQGNCKEGNVLGGKLSINGNLVAEGQPSAPKNLIPYLKEGRNQISIFHRDFHTGHSYYWVVTYIEGVQKKCNKWQEIWGEQCENIS